MIKLRSKAINIIHHETADIYRYPRFYDRAVFSIFYIVSRILRILYIQYTRKNDQESKSLIPNEEQ